MDSKNLCRPDSCPPKCRYNRVTTNLQRPPLHSQNYSITCIKFWQKLDNKQWHRLSSCPRHFTVSCTEVGQQEFACRRKYQVATMRYRQKQLANTTNHIHPLRPLTCTTGGHQKISQTRSMSTKLSHLFPQNVVRNNVHRPLSCLNQCHITEGQHSQLQCAQTIIMSPETVT